MSNWQEKYKKKFVTPEDAAELVKSDDRVVFPLGTDTPILSNAIYTRKEQLENVEILACAPSCEPGWWSEGPNEAFNPVIKIWAGPLAQPSVSERKTDFKPGMFSMEYKLIDEMAPTRKEFDVVVTQVTPPNKQGFCCLGPALWGRASHLRRAKKIIVEVHPDMIHARGENMIHVSKIDRFVEGASYMTDQEMHDVISKADPSLQSRITEIANALDPSRRVVVPLIADLSRDELEAAAKPMGLSEPDESVKAIMGYVEELIKDGDTIQIGHAGPTQWLAWLGTLDNKIDLGYHSEMAVRGIGRLVKEGVITGRHKTINSGKAVAAGWSGCDAADLEYIDDNPQFHLYDTEYTHSIPVIAAHENMKSINNIAAIDLTGQVNSETILGPRIYSGHGGQPEFSFASVLSKGGQSILLLESTAVNDAVSRIVPMFEPGTCVTIPRYLTDTVVTEFGYVRLLGLPIRERVNALISIAHPDFRTELRKEAQKIFWP